MLNYKIETNSFISHYRLELEKENLFESKRTKILRKEDGRT